MLNAIIRFSLQHRPLVLALTAFSMVYGGLALQHLPVDVLPDLNRPTVTVISDASGMAPEEVEVVVTRPIETALNGTSGVTRIYSSSVVGLSVVRVEFEWGTDLRFARLAVSERLQLARERMPKDVNPYLSPTSSILGEIHMIGLTSKAGKTSAVDLRTLADWTLRPRLLTIPGVSQVTVIGGDPLQAQILVNADQLRKKQINILELQERLGKISSVSGGGFLIQGDKESLVRNIGRILNHDEIANTAIGMHFGKPVFLKDVARVEFAPSPKRGEASVSGRPGVILMIHKQPSADTLKVTETVEKALKEMSATFDADVQLHGELFKQAHFIRAAVGNVVEALRDGSIIVAIILILFLMNIRTTAITLTAIPVSFLVTAVVFRFLGIGVNTMTLGGLAIAIGELVDDAIVDVENVYRRLRENRLKDDPRSVIQVVYEASSEVRNSIVLATVIVVLVFIPLFALPGLEGRLFVPIGIAYVVSLIASLVISLTLTPVLCSYLLKSKGKSPGMEKDSWLVTRFKEWDRRILERTLDHPRKVMIGSLLAVLVAAALIPLMGQNFLPSFNEGSAMMEIKAKPGISLEASGRLALQIEEALLRIPEVASVGRRTGRSDEDDHAAGVDQSEFEIALNPTGRKRQAVFNEIRDVSLKILPPEVYMSLSQPITHRLDHVVSGVKAQVSLKVFGPDLRVLRQQAAEVRNAVRDVPGIVDLRVQGQTLYPQIKIYALREDLGRYGLIPGDVISSLEAMLQGVPVTQIIEQDRYLEVFLRLDEASKKDVATIKRLPIHVLPTGQVITLGQIADIFETSGPNAIDRENQQRRMVVSFNISGRDLQSVVNDIRKKIDESVRLPEGYFLEIGGQYESHRRGMRLVMILGALSFLGVFFVLIAHFRSFGIALQIMVNIPLALVGAVVAVFLTERNFSIATVIAFITLCGIASRNGIMMISHYIHLMKEEGESFDKPMIIRGSLERLVPVLMTALSSILALAPLFFAWDEAGKEILNPVAVVIVGGLISSTLLDIFLTPVIFYMYGRKSALSLVSADKLTEN